MGIHGYFYINGSVQILSLKVIEQNILFSLRIKVLTNAHPEMTGRVDFLGVVLGHDISVRPQIFSSFLELFIFLSFLH